MYCKSLLIGGVAAILTVSTVKAQIYHEVDKEDLRAVMRQGTNWQRLGLTVADTLSWNQNEDWVSKVEGVSWSKFESTQRIDSIEWNGIVDPTTMAQTPKIRGSLKLSSPILEYLSCYANDLTKLDVTENPKLNYLDCDYCNLAKLDVTKNTELTYLWCGLNFLEELDLSHNTQLIILSCNFGYLEKLDLSHNPQLKHIDLGGNYLTELDLSENTELIYLFCEENGLEKLNVSKNTKLKVLECYWNYSLTELDVTNSIHLDTLICYSNKLTELDVSKNTELIVLQCGYNELTELDVAKNTKLIDLQCDMNHLTELDVTNNTKLIYLDCGFNNLTVLDVSKNTDLITLGFINNKLTEIDVTNNTKLTSFYCYNNLFKFSTLPIIDPDDTYYVYYPQSTIDGGTKAYTKVDLSSEYNINGNITNFEWFDITNGGESKITPTTNNNGIFAFEEEYIDKTLRCRMRNEQFPGSAWLSPPFAIVYEVKIAETEDSIEDETEINFTILPNPAKTQLVIHHSKEISSVLLYDVAGKLLKTYTVKEINPTLDISDLSNGVYFITVDGKSVKFIKE